MAHVSVNILDQSGLCIDPYFNNGVTQSTSFDSHTEEVLVLAMYFLIIHIMDICLTFGCKTRTNQTSSLSIMLVLLHAAEHV